MHKHDNRHSELDPLKKRQLLWDTADLPADHILFIPRRSNAHRNTAYRTRFNPPHALRAVCCKAGQTAQVAVWQMEGVCRGEISRADNNGTQRRRPVSGLCCESNSDLLLSQKRGKVGLCLLIKNHESVGHRLFLFLQMWWHEPRVVKTKTLAFKRG